MKNDLLYTKIMNQLEIIHAENIALMRMIMFSQGIKQEDIDRLSDAWDERFEDERKEW